MHVHVNLCKRVYICGIVRSPSFHLRLKFVCSTMSDLDANSQIFPYFRFDECTTRCMTAVKDKCCQIFCPCCVYDVDRRTKRLSCWDSAFLREFIGRSMFFFKFE